jgi:hypothetical protein
MGLVYKTKEMVQTVCNSSKTVEECQDLIWLISKQIHMLTHKQELPVLRLNYSSYVNLLESVLTKTQLFSQLIHKLDLFMVKMALPLSIFHMHLFTNQNISKYKM